MKNKKLVVSVLALVLAVAVFAGIWLLTRPETNAGSKTITVEVVHKDGSAKTFTYTSEEEYLGPVLLAEKLVVGEMGPYGLVISAVDGETADWNVDNSYWALYIGQEYATTGADGVVLTDGALYRLVYTIG